MTDYVGIVRTNVRLERAMKRLDLLHIETEEFYQTASVSPQLCELRNLITVGYLIVKSASSGMKAEDYISIRIIRAKVNWYRT